MRLSPPSLKIRLLVMLVLVPVVAWFAVRPVRVIAPELSGVSCLSAAVCVDDTARFEEAVRLHAEGMDFVSAKVNAIHGVPKMVFCATQACADAFGLGRRSAVTLGTFGTVVGPLAWKPFYVRHELIHYLQAERLGTLYLLLKPQWFVEGMAYALSEDPRSPLGEPFESHRRKFLLWLPTIGSRTLWQAAGDL